MSTIGPVARRPHTSRDVVSTPGSTNLADLLERVLDKGVVVAGDIVIALGSVELLTLKLRLLIASIDKARELGIDWWEHDAFLSSGARAPELEGDTEPLRRRLDRLERLLLPPPQEADQEHAAVGQQSTAAPAYVLDKQGRPIAELKLPWEHEQGDEGSQAQERPPQPADQLHQEPPHAPERPPQPEAAQAEQPTGAGPLLGQALQERIAQAVRPVLEELPQRIAQGGQSVEQDRPVGQGGEEQQEEEPPHAPERAPQPQAAPQNAAPAYVLDQTGRLIAELQQPEPAPPAGAGPLLDQALHERMARAVRSVLEELRQRNAQAPQPVEQARPVEQGGEEQQEEEPPHAPERPPQPQAAQNAAPAYVFDEKGRLIAALQLPLAQPHEDEGPQPQVQERAPQPADQPLQEPPHAPERAPQPEAAQAEQPAGTGPLLAQVLHERLAQAVRPVLEGLRQRNAQAPQPVE
jgi:hypothetical protein